MLTLYNTLTKQKEPFSPRDLTKVEMFVCGPTVYGPSHVGHAKTYTQFDFIARYLKSLGYEITYLQNITDVDDKIIRRAAEQGVDPRVIAEKYEAMYLEDMAALRNTHVDRHERAHEYIDAIVSQVRRLIDAGHAYRLDDGWYFDLSSFPDYGKLSGRTELQPEDSVSRIDENQGKRNPGDFALWKARKENEPYWDTPLGPGRPGWHIEDTAITEVVFGAQYDLHGGAVDLIFPHHEAEIAQMEAASGRVPLARHWMHTGLLRVDGNKMSKSSGNFLTIRDALSMANFRTLRYAFLSQHYRSSMELSTTTIEQAEGSRRRVENFARSIDLGHADSDENTRRAQRARDKFAARLSDDIDTPGALAALFEFIRDQNRSAEPPGPAAMAILREFEALFDSFDIGQPASSESEIEGLLERRRRLRAERDFAEADAIRDRLAGRGIVIEDTASGTRWWRNEE